MRYKRLTIKSAKPWECGFGTLTSRMQYSATAFAMPIRRVFKGVWLVTEKVIGTKENINYQLTIEDWIWRYIYAPLKQYITILFRFISRIQGGNVRVYLSYVFFTLILLLWVIS